MRNLKKILALVLALVMSLSLMATASAKDFTDASQISDSYKTAAEVLAGLEVFRGDPDGSFRPTDSITRSEVAAVIYRIATADVNDTQQAIYTNHPFTDVVTNHWATGYISYCYNAEYVKGNGDNTFSPDAKVTGYATLAMILRAMGYGKNGEFEGDGWEIRTASTAKQIGILDKITDAQLGGDATRELVAQILFRALLTETAEFDARLPYQYPTTGETLGYKQFGLEEISGVVVANEFADLNSEQVLADGKTQMMLADGTIKTLDISTKITDIGESRYAYITGNGAKVLTTGDTGLNKVTTFGNACDITTNAKFNAVAEMTKASDIEFYVDFDRSGYWTSDFRIEYEMYFGETTKAQRDEYVAYNDGWFSTVAGTTLTSTDGIVNDTVYHKVITVGKVITNEDYSNMRDIFYASNGKTNSAENTTGPVYIGKVFVATQTKDDVSDELSFVQFVDKYLNDKVFNDNWGVSFNGDWVKFVDNDGDGEAEYAFLTNSWLDEALETYKNKSDETVTVYASGYDDDNDPRTVNDDYRMRYLDADGNDTDEVPAVGTKVVAAWIDNQILVEVAESETATVSSYSWRENVITTDKGEFGQSGIGNATDMMQYIASMADKTEYIMYFDHFGYVRAYEWPGASNYTLVTEIYARNNANGNLVREWPMKVELVQPNEEGTKGEAKEYDLTGGSSNLFVTSSHNNQDAWSLIDNYSATGNYYNWLQPATAHMGVNATSYAPVYGVGTLADNTFYTYWANNRQAVRQIQALTANDTFDYGAKTYSNVKNEGTVSFTNVAIATIDGESAALQGAARLKFDKNGNVMTWTDAAGNTRARYAVDYVQLSTEVPVAAGAVRYPIASNSIADYVALNNTWVNAVNETEYYIVHDNGVEYFKGFASMPALTADNVGEIHAAYAVAKDVSADNASAPYWVADVIVYEVEKWNSNSVDSLALAYYTPFRTTGDVQNVDTINAKYSLTQLQPGGRAWNADQWQWGADWEGYGFYRLVNETAPNDSNVMTASNITRIGYGEYEKNNVHAGIITREAYIANGGYYIDVLVPTSDVWTNYDNDAPDNEFGGFDPDDGYGIDAQADDPDSSFGGYDPDSEYYGNLPMYGYEYNKANCKVVSIEITDKIYSVTTNKDHPGDWAYNEATLLRYVNANNSQVKAGDRVIWVGEAKKAAANEYGVFSKTNFVVDLGNEKTNAEIWATTASFLAAYPSSNLIDLNPTSGEWYEIVREEAKVASAVASKTKAPTQITITVGNNTLTKNIVDGVVEVSYNEWNTLGTSAAPTYAIKPAADNTITAVNGVVTGAKKNAAVPATPVEGNSTIVAGVDKTFQVVSVGDNDTSVAQNYTITVKYGAQGSWGNVISLNPGRVVVVGHDDDVNPDGHGAVYDIMINDAKNMTITYLESLLGASHDCKIVEFKAYGDPKTEANLVTDKGQTCDTPVWYSVVLENANHVKSPVIWLYNPQTTPGIPVGTTYEITVNGWNKYHVEAYTDYDSGVKVPDQSISVNTTTDVATITAMNSSGIQLAATGVGKGTWTISGNGGATCGNNWHPEVDQSTCWFGVNGADSTLTFTPDVVPETLQSKVVDYLEALTTVVTIPNSTTAPTAADILAAVKAAVQAELGAEAAALVTAVGGTTTPLTSAATANTIVRANAVTATVKSEGSDADDTATVNSVEFLLVWTEADLIAAVEAKVDTLTSISAGTMNTPGAPAKTPVENLTDAIETALKAVAGVSNVSVTDLVCREGTGTAAAMVSGDKWAFNWSLTYNGETVTGTDEVTLTA